MRTDRLLKLADFLETVPRRAFRMDYWVQRKASKPEGDEPGECGFAGCAMGWAAHQKMFKGLREDPIRENTITYKLPNGEQFDDFYAAAKVFDISSVESDGLFNPRRYNDLKIVRRDYYGDALPTPKQVAKRIRAFVKNAEAK